jgi:hypothetical protein
LISFEKSLGYPNGAIRTTEDISQYHYPSPLHPFLQLCARERMHDETPPVVISAGQQIKEKEREQVQVNIKEG